MIKKIENIRYGLVQEGLVATKEKKEISLCFGSPSVIKLLKPVHLPL